MTKIRNDKFLTAFGEKVRELRKKKGMSQYVMSYASDIPKSQIVRIEKGEINTGISSVSAIAKALEIHPRDLFDF
jgi:transcriptional regulator with XRE-family HTH domain